MKAQYTKVCAGVSVKVATMALKEAGHYNGAISLGIFATSLLVGGVTAYRRSRNNKDLKELLLLMEAMSGKLEGLTSISTFFNDKLKAMVDAMNRYAVRIEKIIRLSSYDTEECEDDTERVIVLAQNIIENTNELKQKFDGMAKEIKSILSGLRTIILEFNPDAKLNG
ncbi:uncharacterized protein EV154DRAFT_531487 [Mucor mucedo]|uniref:uncharacterized protein n=1 Tax=Mucor mucedo TaxID=29922 RepID=UPI00222108C1|nr:uncharacterized protein EV154DRAFT_531487 [Mucor mucedo]KAI7868209.1 hypothetical protein EV154DRAFT_531487 [Mucor mucedo]